MRVLARIETGRWSARLVLIGAFIVVAALFALLPKSSGDSAPASGAPDSYDSSKVTALLTKFPDADKSAAIVVFSRPDGDSLASLTASDRNAVEGRISDLAGLSTTPRAVQPQFSQDGTAALVVIPVEAASASADIGSQADAIRDQASDGLPSGLRAQLTGPVGFQADTVNAFAGADIRLLLITAGVVALLLIITYRSPVLWLVPLIVVAVADGLARFIVSAIATRFDIAADASILGILSVLVFGAGTNYALLLIARYREELIRQDDSRAAMRTALQGAGPAILASGSTVIVSVLMLLFASLAGNRALGIACAVGIALALAFALLVLPAALVVCGRGLFWPFVPKTEHADSHHAKARASVWARVGTGVSRRPVIVGVAAVLLAGFLATGLVGARIGLDQTDQLIGNPESVQGEQVLSDAFSSGYGSQTTVLTPRGDTAEATRIAKSVSGVTTVRAGDAAVGYTQLTLTLDGAPQSDANFTTITNLRSAYADASGSASRSLVGGSDAAALDEATAAQHDRDLIIPLILGVVFVILVILLRALVAPILLIASVVATFFASLGAGNWLFQHVFGFAAFDTRVVLFAFLFLVALGVDYNIFLATRAREERVRLGAREGMREALTRTGGVITSAGILLAAVFVVLGVLPVVALAQIGTIVCIGVLLDTLVVRTLLVPALAFLTGERFWWPSVRP